MLKRDNLFILLLSVLSVIVFLLALANGAVPVSLKDMVGGFLHALQGKDAHNLQESVFMQLRLPRVLLCMITGAVLAVSGVLMQGLFRNPIVEPGLIGTSSGAAFGASLVFVLSAGLSKTLQELSGPFLVPLFAFAGGLLATYAVYAMAKSIRRIDVTTLLLIGIAVNAVGISGTGFMSYVARDPQARSITFWNLGTFSGASWIQVVIAGLVAALVFILSLRYAKQLNILVLGEEEALYAGVDTTQLKRKIMLYNTAIVSVVTAFVGVISFMGLIVPHLMRLLIGSDNRKLLPASMLAGALLLTLADMGARLLLAPAEIPIGIITSLVGAPVFIILLKRTSLLTPKGGEYD